MCDRSSLTRRPFDVDNGVMNLTQYVESLNRELMTAENEITAEFAPDPLT
jgi:hypothetical protein